MQSPFDAVKQTILRQVSSGILPAYIARLDLYPETTLLDLGLDSLGTMTLIVELENHFLEGFPATQLSDNLTLGEIAARMGGEGEARRQA